MEGRRARNGGILSEMQLKGRIAGLGAAGCLMM